MPGKIVLAGEGGQGVQTIAKIIAMAAQKSNKQVSYLPSFGVEQRGGVSLAFIQISTQPIAYPRFLKTNIALAFCNRAIEPLKDLVDENSLLIYDNSTIDNRHLEKIKSKNTHYLPIAAAKLGREKFSIKAANMILLGALTAHLKDIDFTAIENAIIAELKAKIEENPEIKDINLGALKEGLSLAENFDPAKDKFEGKVPKEIETKFQKENISWTRFPEYCKGCGLCLIECPVQALRFSEDVGFLGNPLPIVDIQKCIGCGKCQNICPDGAIKVNKN